MAVISNDCKITMKVGDLFIMSSENRIGPTLFFTILFVRFEIIYMYKYIPL